MRGEQLSDIYQGPPKPACLEVFMINKLVFRWPKPVFFMVLGPHGIYSCVIIASSNISDHLEVISICVFPFISYPNHPNHAAFLNPAQFAPNYVVTSKCGPERCLAFEKTFGHCDSWYCGIVVNLEVRLDFPKKHLRFFIYWDSHKVGPYDRYEWSYFIPIKWPSCKMGFTGCHRLPSRVRTCSMQVFHIGILGSQYGSWF